MQDYIIFDKAPHIIFNSTEIIYDWYANTFEESERVKISGTITTANCSDNLILSDVSAEIKIRGNYTANYDKKPFQIKFNEKQNLFGLSNGKSFKKWILLAEYNDSSMLRNALAFYMGQQFLGKNTWSPTFTFVHFYIQDPENLYYMGMYLLCDQKEQAKNRVNVFEPEDGYEGTDIGYFFERDDYYETSGDPTFIINNEEYLPTSPVRTNHESNMWARQAHGTRFNYDGFSIKSKITNENAQVAYLKDRMLKIYIILYNAANNGSLYELDATNNLILSQDSDPEKVLRKTIDLDSFINMYILHEMTCNPDLGHSSFYFSLDMSEQGSKLLTLNCPWDFDLAIGIARGFAENPTTADLWAKECTLNPWISLLIHADWFKALADKRWQELYDQGILYKLLKLLDIYSENYIEDFAQNFEEWDIHFKRGHNKTWNVATDNPRTFVKTEYYRADSEADCKALLKAWVNERFVALHSLFNGQGSTDWPEPPAPDPGKAGQIFRKDKLVQIYTVETWNEMYKNAATQADELTKLWNLLYTNPSNAAVILYNKMYAAVASGKKLTDPELQADLEAWNANAAR